MRIMVLLITVVVALQFCGCDGEMWISTGDDGWTSDFDQPWPPSNSAASAGGTATTSGKKKTGTSETTKTDSTPVKTENLELTLGTPATVKAGEDFSVSLTVKNSTGTELKNLTVEGVVPAGLKVTDASGQVSMRWKIKSLPAGESKSLTARLKAASQGSYNLSARATADGGKVVTANADVKVDAEQQKK